MKDKIKSTSRPRKWVVILAVILLLSGVGVLFYPNAQQVIYENKTAGQKTQFLKTVQEQIASGISGSVGVSPYDALLAIMKAKNQEMFETGQSGLTDAFAYANPDPGVNLADYGINDNCVGFIDIPSIHIELPIYLGASAENMQKGAVHLTQTSYPIGGENTNCVIAAHRGVTLMMFRNIDRIQIGDEITVTNFWETLTYKAVEVKIADPTDIAAVKIQPGRDLVTLISCTPYRVSTQRYILYCERVN